MCSSSPSRMRVGLAAVARRRSGELELGTRPHLRHTPRQLVAGDHVAQAGGQPFGQAEHMLVGGVGHHLGQVGAHGGHGQQVGRKGGADAAMPWRRVALGGFGAAGHVFGKAVHGAWHAARYRFAHHKQVWLQAVGGGIATGAAADGVGLVNQQQRAVLAAQCLRPLPEAGLGLTPCRYWSWPARPAGRLPARPAMRPPAPPDR